MLTKVIQKSLWDQEYNNGQISAPRKNSEVEKLFYNGQRQMMREADEKLIISPKGRATDSARLNLHGSE
jgi:hypothetical protein